MIDKDDELLDRPVVKEMLEAGLSNNHAALQEIKNNIKEEFGENANSVLLSIGICALNRFIQCNWTGPLDPVTDMKDSDAAALKCLKVESEDVYSLVVSPWLLVVARTVFLHLQISEGCWWAMRTLFIHQQLLSESSPSLHCVIMVAMEEAGKLDEVVASPARFSIECSFIHLYYQEWRKAKESLESVQKALGMSMGLIGALGKRTKFQEKSLPQLALTLDKRLNLNNSSGAKNEEIEVPKNLMLNDEVRLEQIEFENQEEVELPRLSTVEQAAVLATFVQHERFGPRDEIRDSELKVYLDCLLSQPRCWSIQASTLVSRCKLECRHGRTVERAMTQMQEMLDAIARERPHPKDRLEHFFCSKLPPRWDVEKLYAELLFSLGITKEALDVFTRLQLWGSVINCYFRLERKDKAEAIARRLVEENRTPTNLCLLGDTTDDPALYEEAWELSNHRSARAQRALGNLHFNKQRYKECIPHYEKSVETNGTQLSVWFRLAFAAMETEEWKTAARAYHRCANLDPDSFEAWNNLSKCYVKMGQKNRAWKTLQEALKCNYEEWKIWDNYLVVSADCAAFDEVIVAYNRLIDIKEKHVDGEILKLLARVIVEEKLDCDGQSAARFTDQALKLMGRITAKVPGCPEAWQAYADILSSKKEQTTETLQRSAQYLQKATRCETQVAAWEKDAAQTEKVLESAARLAAGSVRCSERCQDSKVALQMLSSARMTLKGLVTRVKQQRTDVSSGKVEGKAGELLEEVEEQLQQINERMEQLRAS